MYSIGLFKPLGSSESNHAGQQIEDFVLAQVRVVGDIGRPLTATTARP
jgi:hypothetical protein